MITPYLGGSLCCHSGPLWCSLVTPRHTLAPRSRMSRCCVSQGCWLWPAGKLLSDWVKTLTGRLHPGHCTLHLTGPGRGRLHIAVYSFLHFLNVNELFFLPFKCFLLNPLPLISHCSFRGRDDILYNAIYSRPDIMSESQSMGRGEEREDKRKVHLCKFFCLCTPLCYVNVSLPPVTRPAPPPPCLPHPMCSLSGDRHHPLIMIRVTSLAHSQIITNITQNCPWSQTALQEIVMI